MAVLCIGDSLTYGNVGCSYIHFLKSYTDVINKGVNGDTTRHTLKRLRKILRQEKYQSVDTFIISIGINDVLLPYLTSVSFLWKLKMKRKCREMECITDDRVFADEYEKYLKLLSKQHKKVIMIGLPYVQLEKFPHRKVKNRNKMLARLAQKYNCAFINMYSIQLAMSARPGIYTWKHKNISNVLDAAIMTVLPFTKKWFGEVRRLGITVDGVHFNPASARALAEKIIKFL